MPAVHAVYKPTKIICWGLQAGQTLAELTPKCEKLHKREYKKLLFFVQNVSDKISCKNT